MEELLMQKNPEEVEIESNGQKVSCYYLELNLDKAPAIILIEEIWGVNDHIRDIANRFRNEGYVVLAPELLGDIFKDVPKEIFEKMKSPETKIDAQQRLREYLSPLSSLEFGKETVEKLQACFNYLKEKENVGNIGVVGFCFGGTYSYALAIEQPELKAAVPFYGKNPSNLDDVKKIKCPVMAFYGEQDESIMSNLNELVEKMKEYNVNFKHFVYPNTGHAFFNDTNLARYNKEAAEDSWKKVLDFLEKNLK